MCVATFIVQSLGSLLLSYSSPTDAEPYGSIIVEALYGYDTSGIGLIVFGCIIIVSIIILIVALVAIRIAVSAFVSLPMQLVIM